MRDGLIVKGTTLELYKPKPRSVTSDIQEENYHENVFAFKKEYHYRPIVESPRGPRKLSEGLHDRTSGISKRVVDGEVVVGIEAVPHRPAEKNEYQRGQRENRQNVFVFSHVSVSDSLL